MKATTALKLTVRHQLVDETWEICEHKSGSISSWKVKQISESIWRIADKRFRITSSTTHLDTNKRWRWHPATRNSREWYNSQDHGYNRTTVLMTANRFGGLWRYSDCACSSVLAGAAISFPEPSLRLFRWTRVTKAQGTRLRAPSRAPGDHLQQGGKHYSLVWYTLIIIIT